MDKENDKSKMIIDKEINIRITSNVCEYYKKLGYIFKCGDFINIKIEHLKRGSNFKVNVKCHKCGNISEKSYRDYLNCTKKDKNYYCNNCKFTKINKTIKEIYGVDNISKLDKIKEKKVETLIKNFGVDSIFKIDDNFNKIKNSDKNYKKMIETYKNKHTIIFFKESKKIHNNFYLYNKCIYNGSKNNVIITCPIHGYFLQTPNCHLNGQGCPVCRSSKGEKQIEKFLLINKIQFQRQKKFNDCKNLKELPFDFYLTEKNICIEYDGEQHYKEIKNWGGLENLNKIKLHDKIKTQYCKRNNIKLIRIPYFKFKEIDSILQKIIQKND